MFRLEDMAIDTIVVVAIMISVLILAYILTAIITGWRQHRRAEIDRRRRYARGTMPLTRPASRSSR
jgi:hypothetical protein